MGQHPQLNLGVVRVHQQAVLRGEELPQLPADGGAHGDVLQVGLGAGDAPGAGLRLVEGGVHPPVRADHLQQPVAVGGFQLGHGAVAQHLVHHRVEQPQLLQHVGVGGPAALGLFPVGQAQLAEQGLSQLLGGVDVELVPHLFDNLVVELVHLGLQLFAVSLDALLVHIEADVLHLGQHKAEGDLDGLQQLLLAVLRNGLFQGLTQPRHGRPKVQLRLLEVRQGHAVLGAEALHVVAGGGGIQKISRQGRVHADGLHLAAQFQGPAVEELGVIGVFLDAVIFEEGPQESLVRLYPVDLPLVGKHQAGQLPRLPLGVEICFSRVLQHGQQGGAVLIVLLAGALRGGGVLLGLGV